MEVSAVFQRKQSEKKRKKRETPTPAQRTLFKKSGITTASMDAGIEKEVVVSSEQVVVLMGEECKTAGEKSGEVLGHRSKGCCSVM